MSEYLIITYENNVYECLNCGFKSEPPWMTPPKDIAQDTKDHFIDEHKGCPSRLFADNVVKNTSDMLC
jgi:hypothetical protein